MELSEKALAELEKLGALKASGALTDEEFTRLKEEILSAPSTPSGYRLVLLDGGPNKILVIKVVRELTGLGLREAKDLVDGAPRPIPGLGVLPNREVAELHATKLFNAGAITSIEELNPGLPSGSGHREMAAAIAPPSNAVTVRFADVSQSLDRRCKVMIDRQVVARCEAGESISVEIDGPTEIQLEFAGNVGRPSVLANPGDCFAVKYGLLGRVVIDKA